MTITIRNSNDPQRSTKRTKAVGKSRPVSATADLMIDEPMSPLGRSDNTHQRLLDELGKAGVVHAHGGGSQLGVSVVDIDWWHAAHHDIHARNVISNATPYQLVQIERDGIPGVRIKALAREMHLPIARIGQIIGAPKATLERKISSRTNLKGSSAHAALGTLKLIEMVEHILAESMHPDAKKVNAATWLGEWIEKAQPSLGGKKPAEIMDTPTGMAMVSKVLGAVTSGAYL